jgi:cellulose synthase/poly-beta-1,6-N-acetylglucosamine synthase-like glycosyltransferase
MKGWKFIFLNDVVAPAELPVDMNGFKSQQHRWTKGSIQTCKKLLGRIWRSDLPFMIKAEATAHLTANFAYLLLILLCFLIFPGAGDSLNLGASRLWLIDVPIFLMASVSVAAFYLCSQRALYPRRWYKEILYLPFLLALGIGMSINNGKAVLEALFNQKSAFIRTPKYGIESKKQSWRTGKYTALKSLAVLLEVALALYFSCAVLFAYLAAYWMSVPFMMLFAFGFWYVSLGSIAQMLPSDWWRFRPAGAESIPA